MNRLIYICLLCSGMGKAARSALQSELAEMQQREEFPCAVTTKLNKAIVQDFMPHARGRQTWARKASWMRKFYVFSQQICDKSGVRRSAEQCLRSEVMCRHFIAHVATENKGPTRPRSARMVLSAERAKRGWTSLSENPTISAMGRSGTTLDQKTIGWHNSDNGQAYCRQIRQSGQLVEKTNSIDGSARLRVVDAVWRAVYDQEIRGAVCLRRR